MLQKTSLNSSEKNYTLPYTLKETPVVSEKSMDIFKKVNAREELKYPDSLIGMNKKVERFEKMAGLLEKAKLHPKRDKLLSVLATAFVLSILVGGILGTYFSVKAGTVGGGVAAGLIPISTFFIVFGLVAFFSNKFSDDIDNDCSWNMDILLPLFVVIIGPFIPPFETFRKIPSYEKSLPKQKKQIEDDLKELKTFVSENYNKITSIKNQLDKEIFDQEKLKNDLELQRIKTPEAEKSLSKTIEELTQAQAALNAIFKLCSKEDTE